MFDIVLIIMLVVWLLSMYCIFIDRKLGHKLFGWHFVSNNIGFDGASNIGKCDYCNKDCLQDSQGNWF